MVDITEDYDILKEKVINVRCNLVIGVRFSKPAPNFTSQGH
jgi:hypothetical protein